VVGCIPEWQDKILLCRRGIEPRYGLWTLPAGFLENGETTEQGAIRETMEEAKARVEIGDLYTLYNLPHVNQVYILFRARLLTPDFGAGLETLEARLFAESHVPWNELAFATIRGTLTHYYEDRRAGAFRFHIGTITSPPQDTPTAA
jgi:ADP-ribose pyrophosphatase YjhB (NUDIX family)